MATLAPIMWPFRSLGFSTDSLEKVPAHDDARGQSDLLHADASRIEFGYNNRASPSLRIIGVSYPQTVWIRNESSTLGSVRRALSQFLKEL
jgi:hypothetical protein